jgi:hypothetical protein
LQTQVKEKTKEIRAAIQAGQVFEEVKKIYMEKKNLEEKLSQFRQI